jgi:tetratricopeptide (TPR) repeat protein
MDLGMAKARFLLAAERWDEARSIFEDVRANGNPGPDMAQGLLLTLGQLGRHAEAVAVGEDAVRKLPDHSPLRTGLASTLLQLGDAKAAQPHIGHALSLNRYDQTALALQGLAWRLADDGREQVLNDYEQAVQVINIAPPEGYRDMAQFNQDLNAFLDGLHPPVREYIDQSLRQGTQTTGLLFDRGLDLVERLKDRIAQAVQAYVADMPVSPDHPFFGRRGNGFRFEGSWSSRLRSQGFHTSHIHAGGWISSCYYVALPDVIADEKGKQGWLEFGRPSKTLEGALHLKDPVCRAIRPGAGQLALFPSYMFHGTVPFRSGQDRTTIAFDALPL